MQALSDSLKRICELGGTILRAVAELYMVKDFMKDTGILQQLFKMIEADATGNSEVVEEVSQQLKWTTDQLFVPLKSAIERMK